MSADNILVILQKQNNVTAVYNVGYSALSVHESFKEKLTKEDSAELTKYILDTPHYREVKEFPKKTPIAEITTFCQKYMEEELVEYGYINIIVHY